MLSGSLAEPNSVIICDLLSSVFFFFCEKTDEKMYIRREVVITSLFAWNKRSTIEIGALSFDR